MSTRSPSRLLVLLLLVVPGLAAFAAGPGTARAQPAGLTMVVRGGYEKFYKVGAWFPVQVELQNDGAGLIQGWLEVNAYGENDTRVATYRQAVELAAPGRKVYTLTTWAASYTRAMQVRLVRGDGALLLERPVQLEPKESPAYLLGVVSNDAGLLNSLNNVTLGTQGGRTGDPVVTVAHLGVGDLPTGSTALDGLDGLVLAGVDTGTLAQTLPGALAGWVTRGGTLVVTGGGNAPGTAAGLGDLLPVAVTGSAPGADLAPLATYAGGAAPLDASGGAPVALAVLLAEREARVLAGTAGQPLLVVRSYGAGQVIYLAADPALPPLRDWPGTPALWGRLLGSTPPALSAAAQRRIAGASGGYYYPGSEFNQPFQVAGLQLPNVWLVGGFLVLYVVLVGPVNYLVLRALRRLEAAWVTIPVMILLFVAGAYGLGFLAKGNTLRLIESQVIRVGAGTAVARVDGFVGLFSPTRTSYNLSYPGEVALTEIQPSGSGLPTGGQTLIVQGPGGGVRDLTINTWALRGFLLEGTAAYPSPLTATLRLDGTRVRGRLLNTGATPLRDVALYHGGGTQWVGTLGSGAATEVNLPLQATTTNDQLIRLLLPGLTNNSNADATTRRRAALLQLALDGQGAGAPTGITVVGWGAPAALAAAVGGGQPVPETETVILAELPLPMPGPGGVLPPDLVPWQVVAGQLQPGYYGGNSTPTADLSGAPLVAQFTLPPGFTPASLNIHYNLDTQGDTVQLDVYNWAAGAYDPVAPAGRSVLIQAQSFGAQGDVALGDGAAFVGPHGEVTVRLSAPSGSYVQATIQELSLSGTSK